MRLDVSEASGKQTFRSSKGVTTFEDDIDGVELLPMASIAYDFTPNVTAYATYAQGFLAGGYNYFSAEDEETFSYDAEYTTNYEVGLKTNWLDKRLTANLALFYTDIDDKQVLEEEPGGGIGTWDFTNAAKAHSMGFELEVKARPISGVEVFGGIGWAPTEIDDWIADSDGVPYDYSGKEVPWAPELTYNLGVGYYHDSGLFGIVDLFGAGKQYFDAENTLEENGYQLVNVRLGYRFKRLDLEAAIWCNNLFDSEYAVKKVRTDSGNILLEDGEPQTLGVSFNWRF
jgi:iron complex outermembrane receptor protein